MKGLRLIPGWLIFCLVCSTGALANISVASLVMDQCEYWALAGTAGGINDAA